MDFKKVSISELFLSIDGEGVRAGQRAIFIRFTGCNVRCRYCDSCYALTPTEANPAYETTYDVAQAVLQHCVEGVINNITITGGEPLLYPAEIIEILNILNQSEYAFSINIETNGTISPTQFLQQYVGSPFHICHLNDLFFTFDIKTPAAGEDVAKKGLNAKGVPVFVPSIREYQETVLPLSNRYSNVIKAVVGSVEDLDYVRHIYEDGYAWRKDFKWYVSPVYGDIEPADIVEYMLTHPVCATWNMQLQMHKYIWGWEKRGV